jgi:hypothetical protein
MPDDDDAVAGLQLPTITNEHMREGLSQAKRYTLALLRTTSSFKRPEMDSIVWEHGRRNFALREQGVMPVVLPVDDDSDLAGLGVFDATEDEVARILDEDPGVKAGIFTFELHPVRGFPGSTLPG